MFSFKTIGVLGAGTMGRGIVQVCAQHGFQVIWCDVSHEVLNSGFSAIQSMLARLVEKGKLAPSEADEGLGRISRTVDMADFGPAQMVIEAVPEVLELKKKVFAELVNHTQGQAILATNTSSLSISEIAKAAHRHQGRVIGLHFFNPVPVMKLLEIVHGNYTSEETLEAALDFGRSINKETIVVKDSPGFATSRLGLALGLEAIRMFESGVATAHDIDRAMELGYNHPVGPLKLTDLIGLDVRLQIAEYLYEKLGSDAFKPPAMLRELVERGCLGKKTGKGFYLWDEK